MQLDQELESFVASQVRSGRYANEDEVIAEALRVFQRDTEEDDAKMERLLAALDHGLASGVAPPGVFDRVRKRAGLPVRGDDD
jgi:putative addiction module CopG family antidote